MEQIILIVHLLVALAIIGLIMLQQGKGADMGASFGAGASQTLFGSAGSGNALTKATAWLVVLFFASSFGLALLATQNTTAVDDLGLELPPAAELQQGVQQAAPVDTADSDLPQVNDSIPEVESAPEGDVPEL
ncbi:preprotein translocase subunit SecG [Parahaliea maris]|uniref:Protein-export membrane protein SecG n=1 Tax=Parahaliea maris TaxID=2716870 RepID=A0A5C9A6B2_9GAMM|nr:preprotein translocase subunit SecG [Parahaliea maris]TXS96483.1 preprotein translocase subunit SecG [Parahaliea maris]